MKLCGEILGVMECSRPYEAVWGDSGSGGVF